MAVVLGVIVLLAAGPAVFSAWPAAGPATASAADKVDDPGPAKKAAGKADDAPPAKKAAEKRDEPPAKKAGAAKEEPPAAKKAATGPAEKAPREKATGEKPPEEKTAAEEPTTNKEEKLLVWLYHSMGLRYVIIFLAVTFNEVALVVMIVLGLRRNCICPPDLIAEFDARLKKKQYQEAYDLAKKDGSFLGKVLAAGMSNLSDGYEAAQEAMQEVGEEQTMRLEQRNGNIALIAQIGPMLGLLATVDGIVRAFAVIASKDVTPKPSELAQGIGIALVNTVVGLWLAIPSIIFYHYVRNRLTRLIFETGAISGRLMKRFTKLSVTVTKT
jgi:biopolymer transport protein ExbB